MFKMALEWYPVTMLIMGLLIWLLTIIIRYGIDEGLFLVFSKICISSNGFWQGIFIWPCLLIDLLFVPVVILLCIPIDFCINKIIKISLNNSSSNIANSNIEWKWSKEKGWLAILGKDLEQENKEKFEKIVEEWSYFGD